MGTIQPVQFFYENAGYSYDPKTESVEDGRWRCAWKLAKAEEWARDNGLAFEWAIDPDSNASDFGDGDWSLWQCCAHNESGSIVASLHGIDFGPDGSPWSNSYRRVVEAELALEAKE